MAGFATADTSGLKSSDRCYEIDASGAYRGSLVFPPGVVLISGAEDWDFMWRQAEAFTTRFIGVRFATPFPVPPLPPVDFGSRSLIVIAASLYSGQEAPRLVAIDRTVGKRIDVVTPDRGGEVSHLDFYQHLLIYDVPVLVGPFSVNGECGPGGPCVAESKDLQRGD